MSSIKATWKEKLWELLSSDVRKLSCRYEEEDRGEVGAILFEKREKGVKEDEIESICEEIESILIERGMGIRRGSFNPTGGGEGDVRGDDFKKVFFIGIKSNFEMEMDAAESIGTRKQLKSEHGKEIITFSKRIKDCFQGIEDEASFFSHAEKIRHLQWHLETIPLVSDTLSSSSRFHARLLLLHNDSLLSSLYSKWVTDFLSPQPLELVRQYMGEKISLYFAFLGFYTKWLVFPALFGLFVHFSFDSTQSNYWIIFYSVFLIFWGCLLCEAWKRKCAYLAWNWDVWKYEKQDEPPRAGWQSEDTTTATTRRYLKYLITFPIIFLFVVLVVVGMLFFFQMEELFGVTITIVLYGVFVPFMSSLYRKIAVHLNDFENYKTHTEYENHLVMKLLLFEGFNCFLLLFYTAFWKRDIDLLREYLAGLLITRQIVGNFLEALLPWYMTKAKLLLRKDHRGQTRGSFVSKIEAESLMDDYVYTFDDMLEMMTQLGYVTLFAYAYPLAPVWSLLNNLVEIRSDAFKLVNTCQMPRCLKASSVGPWLQCMEAISIAAIGTNLFLIAFTTTQFDKVVPDPANKVWAVFLAEVGCLRILSNLLFFQHLIIGLRWLVAYLIPDVPASITKAIAARRLMERELINKQKETKIA